jgi:hypothetical protein
MSPSLKFNFKFSFNRYRWWRIIAILTFGILMAAFLATTFFLYTYIFRRLEDAHTIVMLDTVQQSDTLNLNNYQKAVSLLSLKTSSTPFVFPLRNVFEFPPTSTAPTSTPGAI